MSFSFENLDVYKKSVSLVKRTEILNRALKGKVAHALLDQLIRAVISIPLNIAEGSGRWYPKEKRQFFRIARGSIFEIVPIIQVIHSLDQLKEDEYISFYEDLQTLSKMLMNLIKSVDNLNKPS